MLMTSAVEQQSDYEALKKEINMTVTDVIKSASALNTYQEKASEDAKSVQQALNDSSQAQDDAKKAEGILHVFTLSSHYNAYYDKPLIFIKAFSDTVFDMINDAYYDKPLISIKAVSGTVFDMINAAYHDKPLILGRLFLALYLT